MNGTHGEGKQPTEAIATAKALTTSLDGLAETVDTLNEQVAAQTAYGRRNRRMIWGLAVAVAVAVVVSLAAGIAWAGGSARHANDTATRAHDSQVTTCVSGNESRKLQVQLWEYILTLPPTRPLTDAQRKQRDDFRAYLHKVYAPRDCSRI